MSLYMFIFWIYLPCMRENMQPLSFNLTYFTYDVLQLHPFTFKSHVIFHMAE
jgi:hypothetical protein